MSISLRLSNNKWDGMEDVDNITAAYRLTPNTSRLGSCLALFYIYQMNL